MHIERAILHPEMRVVSGGWEATIRSLSVHGWQFDIHERLDMRSLQLTMRNVTTNLVCGMMIDVDDERQIQFFQQGIYMPEGMELSGEVLHEIRMSAAPIHLATAEIGMPIDISTNKWHIFTAKENEGTAEIIVTPENVPMMLDLIRKAQEPNARELLHNQRKRGELEELYTSAKILTFGT